RANVIDSTRAVRVDQRVCVIHHDRRVCGSDAELGGVVGGDGGAHFDRILKHGEARMVDLYSIDPERDALYDQVSQTVRRQGLLELVGFGNQLHRTLNTEAGGVGDADAQLTG